MYNHQDPAPQALADEVLRKVGRNWLSNQQVEQLLKAILGMASEENLTQSVV